MSRGVQAQQQQQKHGPEGGGAPAAPPTTKQVAATSPPKKTMVHHLLAGGAAGFVESSVWCVTPDGLLDPVCPPGVVARWDVWARDLGCLTWCTMY
jgi:hypothetical protein